jgi:hypothetical protein
METKVTTTLEQLTHFAKGPIWDGNLVSKASRDILFDKGLIDRHNGFQFLTNAEGELWHL